MADRSDSDFAVVGSYTEASEGGLTSFRVEDGSLEQCDVVNENNPSFLDVYPSEPVFVAINECEAGSAVSYRVDPTNGRFDRLDRTETGDASPCHVEIGPRGEYAVVAHYAGGSVALLSLEADGTLNGPLELVRHEGSGPDDDRQASPHPHSTRFITDSIVYVPDLGTDQVVVYELDRADDRLRPIPNAEIDCRPGSGPRHFDVHPTESVGYLVNELTSTLSVVDISDPRQPTIIQIQSTLPDGIDASDTIAADVHVHPSGNYLFASNRGHDSIATFKVRAAPREVVRLAVTPTTGRWPRNFAVHPDGDWIFICHQHSNDVVPFVFDDRAEELRRENPRTKAGTPTCLRFV